MGGNVQGEIIRGDVQGGNVLEPHSSDEYQIVFMLHKFIEIQAKLNTDVIFLPFSSSTVLCMQHTR